MKYIVISLFVALFGLQQTKAQDPISVGQIEFDGIKKVKRGAFWNSRPEAKEIFEKGYSTRKDVVVYKTTEVYLARFKDDEHNSQDGNYLAIPIGFTFYTKGSDPFPYDPECGNQFKYFKPISQIKLVQLPPPCENRYHVTIYRVEDEFGRLLMQDSIVIDGFISKDCRNIVDTTIYIEMWKKQIINGPSVPDDEMPSEKPSKQKDEVVEGNVTINNTYTTNIYGAQRGGPRPTYRHPEFRRSGFIFLGFRGGGGNILPAITPRYDPVGLGGTPPTRWDPPGNGGTNPRFDPIGNGRVRQVFDPAGIN